MFITRKTAKVITLFISIGLGFLGLIIFNQTALAQTPADGIDVVLIIDTSGSMKDNDPEAVRISAAKLFVDLSGSDDRIAIVNLGGEPETGVALNLTRIGGSADDQFQKKREIKETLDTLIDPKADYTNIGRSLKAAYDILDETMPGRRQYVVLLTDGLPTGEDPTILTDTVRAFAEKRYWKIFPIGLGAGANYAFLDENIAKPSGGQTYQADTPEALIRIYTEIFALLRDNRYVNWMTVEPNEMTSILTLRPEQRVTSLAMVVPQRNKDPFVDVILSPNQANIIDPAYASGVFYGFDSRYQAYAIDKSRLNFGDNWSLNGDWQIRLQGQASVEIAVMSRSDYGIQLDVPTPQQGWDQLSARYHPLGEPIRVVSSIRYFGEDLNSFDQGAISMTVTGLVRHLSPEATLISSQPATVTLLDSGADSDSLADDGLYTGQLPVVPDQPGLYTLSLEAPHRQDSPFNLAKSRTFQVMALPRIQVTLPPATNIQQAVPVELSIVQPIDQTMPLQNVELSLYLQEPNGHTTQLETTANTSEQHMAHFQPAIAGTHRLLAVARLQTSVGGKSIIYTSMADGRYEAPLPQIEIAPNEIDLGTVQSLVDIPLSVTVNSNALMPEPIAVQVDGLTGGSVTPSEFVVQPGLKQTVHLLLGSKHLEANGSGQLVLQFSSPADRAEIVGPNLLVDYTITQKMIIRPYGPGGGDLGVVVDPTEFKVSVEIKSQVSERNLPLTVEVKSPNWAEADIFPSQITIPAQETTPFTFVIQPQALTQQAVLDQPEQTFQLHFSSDEVELEGATVTYRYQSPAQPGGSGAIIVMGAALLGPVVGFVLYRRRSQRNEHPYL